MENCCNCHKPVGTQFWIVRKGKIDWAGKSIVDVMDSPVYVCGDCFKDGEFSPQ